MPARNRRTSSVLPPGRLDDPRDLRADLPAHRLVLVLHHYPNHRLRPARPEPDAPPAPRPPPAPPPARAAPPPPLPVRRLRPPPPPRPRPARPEQAAPLAPEPLLGPCDGPLDFVER